MEILSTSLTPDLEDDVTEPPATPADGAELLWLVIFLVHQVSLIEDLLRFDEADAMFLLDSPASKN